MAKVVESRMDTEDGGSIEYRKIIPSRPRAGIMIFNSAVPDSAILYEAMRYLCDVNIAVLLTVQSQLFQEKKTEGRSKPGMNGKSNSLRPRVALKDTNELGLSFQRETADAPLFVAGAYVAAAVALLYSNAFSYMKGTVIAGPPFGSLGAMSLMSSIEAMNSKGLEDGMFSKSELRSLAAAELARSVMQIEMLSGKQQGPLLVLYGARQGSVSLGQLDVIKEKTASKDCTVTIVDGMKKQTGSAWAEKASALIARWILQRLAPVPGKTTRKAGLRN